MKTNMTKILGAVLTLGMLSSVPCVADNPDADGGKNAANALVEALKAAGLDDDAVAEVRKAIQEVPAKDKGGDKAKVQTKVFRKAVIIGPDGKLRTLEDEEMGELDLGKGLLDLKQLKGLEKVDGAKVQMKGKVSVVGPDGKVKEMDLDFGDAPDLGGILKEAMKGIDLEDIDLEVGVFSVGPGVLVQPGMGMHRGDSTKKEIAKLRKELAEQRKLLEKILKKLD